MHTLPSDYLLATTLRAIGDGIISCDRDGNVVLINTVAQQLTGWSEQDALGKSLKSIFVIVNESTREAVEDPVEKVLRLGTMVGIANTTLLIRPDGTEIAIDDSAAPIFNDCQELLGVVLVFRDVSERRRAEWNVEMLSESGKALGQARELSGILGRIGQVVAAHFSDFCVFDILEPNGAMTRTIGTHRLPECQHIADALKDFIPAKEPTSHPIHRVMQDRQAVLMTKLTKSDLEQMSFGSEHLDYLEHVLKPHSILSVPLSADEELIGTVTFVRHRMASSFDSLDKEAAEELGRRVGLALHYAQVREDLRLERARLDAVLAAAPVGIILAERSGKIVMANDEVSRIFRHETRYSADVASHSEYVAFHTDGRQVKGEEYPLPRAMAENQVIRDERYLYAKGDGTRGWISLSAAPVKDENGYIWGGVVAISDIDQLVRSQQQAELSDRRMSVLLDQASVGVAIGDLSGGLSYANETLLRWVGYSKEEMADGEVRWDEITPPEFGEADAEAVRQLRQVGYAKPYEKAYFAKNGRRVPMLVGATCIPSADTARGAPDIAVFFTDLTLQKRAEQVLLQTEKLTAVGRLASSISHEINNPLEAVINLLFIVKSSAHLSQSDRDYLDAADRELARVAQITAQTLRFHRQSTAPMDVRPEDLFEEVIGIYRTRLDSSEITIRQEYGRNVHFMCYEGDLRQVLNNLIGNAFDAMRSGGQLRIRTRCSTWWATGEAGVMLTIADTGAGMTEETRQNIFEAFFSTKGIHGTGLGLWISKRIVHKHRGHLKARSSTGAKHGSVFHLWMPLELAPTANQPWHTEFQQ